MSRSFLTLLFIATSVSCSSSKATPPLAAGATLITDGYGITHIFGDTRELAYRGAGYAMARDRAQQMDYARRRALGTLAEVFGSGKLNDDRLARTLDFLGLGKSDVARTEREHPEDLVLVDAWLAGVNRWLAEAPATTPAPAPWTREQVFAIAKSFAFGLSNSFVPEIFGSALARAGVGLPQVPPFKPSYDVYPMAPEVASARTESLAPATRPLSSVAWPRRPLPDLLQHRESNAWAIGGGLTESGSPILAGDPHQDLSSPQNLWPVQIAWAGADAAAVSGFAYVGTPAVAFGHTERVAWSATTNFADVFDVFSVAVATDRATVQIGNATAPIVARTEVLHVRDEEDQALVVETVPGYGVLFPDVLLPVPRSLVADGDLLVNWTGFAPSVEVSAYFALNRVTSLDTFEAAIDRIEVGAANFIGADATGISYRVGAKVPDRGAPSAGPMPWRVVPGTEWARLWSGAFLPKERIPGKRGEANGFLLSANEDPWGFTADGNPENDPFYYGTYYAPGFRSFAIRESLALSRSNGNKQTPQTTMALQNDTTSLLGGSIQVGVAGALAASVTDARAVALQGDARIRKLGADLAAWNRRCDGDPGAALAAVALEWFLARRVGSQLMPAPYFDAIAEGSPQYVLGLLSNVLRDRLAVSAEALGGSREQWILEGLNDTVAWLESQRGGADVSQARFDDFWKAQFPQSDGTIAATLAFAGCSDTIHFAEGPFLVGGKPVTTGRLTNAPLEHTVVTFDAQGRCQSWFNMARGPREGASSPYFANQDSAWLAGTYLPWRETREAALADAVERVEIR